MTGPLLLALHAVCPLLFFTDLTRNPYATQIYLLQAGLLGVFLAGTLRSLRDGAFVHRAGAFDLPVAAGLAVAAASWGLSWAAHPPLRPGILAEGARMHFFLVVNGLLPFFLAARTDPPWEARIRRATLAVGAVAAAYALLQYAGIEWIWDKSLNPYNGRPVSTFGNPNFLSSYLVMLTPLALREFTAAGTAGRPGWGAVLLLYGAGLIATMTRSSWIGAAAAAGLFLVLTRPKGEKARTLLWIGLALAALALLWPGSPVADEKSTPLSRMAELVGGVTGRGVYGSWHQRLLIWSCARDMLRARPLLGAGWGCFELFYPFHQGLYLWEPLFRGFRTHANNAHNVLLEVASQTGLAGLGVALWVLVLAAALWRRRSDALDEPARSLAAARAAALAGMLADNFFGNVSLFFAVPGFLFAWTAGGFAADAAGGGEKRISLRRPLAGAAASLACLAAAAGIVFSFRGWRAEVLSFEGYKRVVRGDLPGAVRLLEASRGWRRRRVENCYELANAYMNQAREAVRNGLADAARDLLLRASDAYAEAAAANPGYDEVYFNHAAVLLQLGRPPEAARLLKLSLLINPLNPDAHRLLCGLAEEGVDGAGPPSGAFERAARAFPADKAFWTGLGRSLWKEGRPADAAGAFARALGLDADARDVQEALRLSLKAASLPPPPVLSAPALAARVRELASRGRLAEALPVAEELLRAAPEWPLAWLMAADLRSGAGRPEDSLAAYDRFLLSQPDHRAARLNKARALLNLGRKPEAAVLLRRLAAEPPEDPEVRAMLRSLGD